MVDLTDDLMAVFFLIVVVSISVMLGSVKGMDSGVTLAREKAIAANVGQYVADPQTGGVEFVYGCPTK